MTIDTPRGLEGRERPAASKREKRTGVSAAGPTDARLAQAYDDVTAVLHALEGVEWGNVPGFSVEEAGALCARLQKTREKIDRSRGGRP